RVSTASSSGRTGTWLIDPQDFTIGSAPGDNIAGSTLSGQLVTNNIQITTNGAGTENGDIFVNDAVSWSASGGPTTLTLTADRNVDINAAITATNGNLVVCCGQDVNVNAAITTTNGSVLLSAGRDINQRGAITVTDGNLMMCAADDVNIGGAITLTRGTSDPTRSLGLPLGLTLSADTDGSGPGIAGGTVVFDPLAPPTTVTAAPVTIYYNPVSYTAPTDYSTRLRLTEGAALRQFMLVFATGVDKPFDGTTTTTLSGLKGNPDGVTLVAGPGASANFDTPAAGTGKGISFTGYTLAGSNAGAYALPVNCCGPILAHTTGTITAAAPPPVTPPPVTPPPVTPPPVTPPVTPPPETPPVTTVPPVGPPLFVTPPLPVLPPLPPQNVVDVAPEVQSPQTLVATPVPVAAPVYVAPVRAPKPYRN
ncbi:MAG: YDG domain-containing protein, partial [Pseudoxanthomonas sp.]